MMTARLAIGSASTLALGALLVGVAPYWLKGHSPPSGPWGAIASTTIATPASAQADSDRAQLLELAALKSGAATQATVEPPSTPSSPVGTIAQAPATPAPAVVASAQDPAAATQPASEETSSVQMAAELADVPEKRPVTGDVPGKVQLININTASMGTLNRIPGAGLIGHAIVSHRPYKSVKDLVNKRVLRTSDFSKIQARLSVD